MLGLGLKRSDPADLYAPLKEFIASNHSKEDAKKVDDNIQAVNLARTRMLQALDRVNANDYQTALNASNHYLQTFVMISNRFPWGDHKRETFLGFKTGKIPTVKVKFTYYDAWRKNKKVEDSKEPGFEKAWILYNLGALYSLEALREKRNPDDGLKRSMALFTTAAGVFQTILETSEFTRAPMSSMNVDLTADALSLCIALMLAQAQAVFFEKAATTNSSPALTAKLAAGASKLFRQTQAAAEKSGELKGWLNSSDYQWHKHCGYQALIFQAAAHFWHAKSLLASDEYGLEIAHLQRAVAVLADAAKSEGGLIPSLVESRTALLNKVNARLAAAVKDNNSIYYKSVPNPAVTPIGDIEQKVVVKPSPFKLPAEPEQNAFSSLVPTKIAEAASDFNMRVSAFVGSVEKHRADLVSDAKNALMAKNLPAALEAMEPAQGLPEDVWARIKEVQYKGGAKALLDVHAQLQSAVKEAWSLHANIRDVLAKEAKTDSDMRTQFGMRWNRRPSAQITTSYQRDLDACEKFLRDAQASDAKIADDWKTNENRLADLASSHDQLQAKLPKLDATASADAGVDAKAEATATLKHLLDELSALMDKRQLATEHLKKTANDVSIVPILLSAQKTMKSTEQVVNEELAKLNEHFAQLKAEIDVEQTSILTQISSANDAFLKSRSANASAAAREQVLQGFNVAVECYNKLQTNLNEGLKFYTDLLRDFLEPLKQSVTDFMTARNMEAQIILQQLTEDYSNYKAPGSSASAAAAAGANEKTPAGPPSSAGAYAAPAYNPNVALGSGSGSGSGSFPQLPAKASPVAAASAPSGAYEPLDMTPSLPGPASNGGGGGGGGAPQLSSQMPSLQQPARPQLPQSPYVPQAADKPAGQSLYFQPNNSGGNNSGNAGSPTVVVVPPAQGGNAASPASGGGGGWSCPTCTFVNNPNHLQCSMCATQQPPGVAGGAPVASPAAGAAAKPAASPPAEKPKKKSWF